MPRCEGAMPSAMQPVGKRYRSQLRLVHGRERQPAMTTSASAPSTSPQKSPIGCTSSLYHFAHFFHFARSESTKREPTAESSEANIAAPRRPEGRQHPCTSVGWSARVPAFGAHAVLRQIGKTQQKQRRTMTDDSCWKSQMCKKAKQCVVKKRNTNQHNAKQSITSLA